MNEQPDIRIVSGSPSPEELAALTAVLHGVLDELAAAEATSAGAAATAWSRSQRQLRTPLTPGRGVWRSFG